MDDLPSYDDLETPAKVRWSKSRTSAEGFDQSLDAKMFVALAASWLRIITTYVN